MKKKSALSMTYI